MHLAFDIGNSAAKAGLFTDEGKLHHAVRLDLAPATAAVDDWERALRHAFPAGTNRRAAPASAGLSSVVPAATKRLQAALRHRWGLPALRIRAGEGLRLPFALQYRTPATLGADRLAAAAAAWMHYGAPDGRSVLALDAGTALTYEVVRARTQGDGVYEGGAIAPGPALARQALARGTAQLPAVPLRPPPAPIGRSTQEALQSGLFHGFLDSADGMIRRLTDALGQPAAPVVVSTGGWGTALHDHLDRLDHHAPHLVLRGVYALMQLNEGPENAEREKASRA